MTEEVAPKKTWLVEVGVALVLLLGVAGYAILNSPREHRRAGNEVAAIGALRKIGEHQEVFKKTAASGTPRYASSLQELGVNARHASYPLHAIDAVLATGKKQGYVFAIAHGYASGWSATAMPSKPGETGHRSFYMDESGILRFSLAGPADASSMEWDRLPEKWPSPQYDPE